MPILTVRVFVIFQLYLTVMDLPSDTNYSCSYDFGQVQDSQPATSWSSGLGCRTPNVAGLGVRFTDEGTQLFGNN